MDSLFRFPNARRPDPEVEAWLAARSDTLGVMARQWFQRLRDGGADVRELMHDGCPTACVDDAAFAYVGVFKAHVSVGFFQGAELPDPGGLLEGRGKRMRHVKLRPESDLDAVALANLVDAACRDMRLRLGTG